LSIFTTFKKDSNEFSVCEKKLLWCGKEYLDNQFCDEVMGETGGESRK